VEFPLVAIPHIAERQARGRAGASLCNGARKRAYSYLPSHIHELNFIVIFSDLAGGETAGGHSA